MDTDLLMLVCQQKLSELTLEPAEVQHHQPRWVEQDHFPVLVPQPGAVTNGTLIRGLSDQAMQRIVFFEGGEFCLSPLTVINGNGEQECTEYFGDTQRLPVSEREWVLRDWQRESKAAILPRVQRYMQCFGKMSIDEADVFW